MVVEHHLIQDVSTQWNSTQAMLERLLEQRWPVTAVLSDPSYTGKNECSLDLTTAQWNMAEDISNVLKPMVTLTELLSEEDNASLSATIPMLTNLKRRHLAIAEDDSPTTKSLKAKLVEEIDHRWQINDRLFESSLYVQAAVVDPRFKLLPFLDDGKRDKAYICVSQLADRLNAAQRPEHGQAAGTETQHCRMKRGNLCQKKGKRTSSGTSRCCCVEKMRRKRTKVRTARTK
ncbi:hypothetical protein AAFF_G00377940 [Aldrovandia affinis]|uniref:Uncharacterized protein n=1 Tax=Aldrovandia affinis TaxID=143900 RepID=A0AAD7SGA2_9TELE|nr:hypothetical protein AAFF_G00377940 [Aldrovandia affinis]